MSFSVIILVYNILNRIITVLERNLVRKLEIIVTGMSGNGAM